MSQTGPWSVKGIDNRAREAAREAAREEGTTLGAYLNRLILQDDPNLGSASMREPTGRSSFEDHDPINEATDRTAHGFGARPSHHRPHPTTDEPANAALDRLTRRIESAEARSTLAITGIDQSVVGLLSRLENAEHNQHALGNHWESVLGDVQKTYDVLTNKISAIENNDASSRNQAALQALEDALGKLASHVYEENELVSEEASAIKVRLETGLGELSSRMDNVDEAVEVKLREASDTVIKAVADSQLRVEGTNHHLADRFSQLEANVHSELASVTEKSATLDQALAHNQEQFATIQDRLNRAETSTNQALEHLKSTFSSLDARLENIAQGTNTDISSVADDIRDQFQAKFDSLADDMRAMIASTRAEMASEIEVAAKSVDGNLIARLEDTISAMGARLDASEDVQAQTMEMVGDTVTRITESVDQRLVAGQNQQSRDIEQISAQVTRVTESIDRRFKEMSSDDYANVATSELREDMARFTDSMDARFEQYEARDTSSIDRISNEVEQLADKLNERVEESEKRSATAIEQVGEQLADKLNARVEESEKRSATAIEQVGEQVSSVAERLEHRQAQALQEFSAKLDERTKSHEARLSSALTNVSDRLEQIQEQSITTISPVQKAIAALAQRIEAIEDFSAPPYMDRESTPDVPQMVSPVKIDTTIEDTESQFDLSEQITASANFAGADITAEAQTPLTADNIETVLADDTEPFEAGYKNWSETAPDLLDDEGLGLEQTPEFQQALKAEQNFEDLDELEPVEDFEQTQSFDQAEGYEEIESFDNVDDFEPIDGFEQTLDFEADQPVDGTEGSEQADDYFAELPPPADTEEDIFDASNEARDSDIFEDETAPLEDIETEPLEPFATSAHEYAEVLAPSMDAEARPLPNNDFLAQARNAAKSAAASNPSSQRASKSKSSRAGKKSGSKKPVIAAGIGLLAVAGTASFLVMNQDNAPEAVNLANTGPTLPPNGNSSEVPAGLAALNAQTNDDGLDGSIDAINGEDDTVFDSEAEDAIDAADPATAPPDEFAPAPAPAAAGPDDITQSGAATGNIADASAISLNVPPPTSALEPSSQEPLQLARRPVPTIERIVSLSDAANAGNAIAQYQLATSQIASGEITSGVALLRSSEAQGLAAAQYELANLHISGIGVERDSARAIPLYKAAAEAGNVGAMHNYATLIADTPGREAEAANWYLRAAEMGLVEAQFNIATMYESGTGVSPSLHRALYWYKLAAASGDPDAGAAVSDLSNSAEISSAAKAQVERDMAAWTATPRDARANGQFASQSWATATREQVRGIQQVLSVLNYEPGAADGAMGAATRSAIRAFQTDAGQSPSGLIDNALIEALNEAAKQARRS